MFYSCKYSLKLCQWDCICLETCLSSRFMSIILWPGTTLLVPMLCQNASCLWGAWYQSLNFETFPFTLMSRLLVAVWIFPVAQTVKNLPAMQETWIRSLGQKDPLEKGMTIHSSTLAWRIPWTEEPGRPQSMWSQRVRHDWVTNTATTSGSIPSAWRLAGGALSAPSDVYVRSFLCLFYTLIELYYTKALSDQASSLAPNWIFSSGGQE